MCSSRVRFGGKAFTSGVSREREIGFQRVVPTPFFWSRLCRQNFNRAPRQYRQLRRLLVNGRDKYERWYLINAKLISMSLLNKWKKILAIKLIARYVCYQDIFILEGKFLAFENSRFSLLFAAARSEGKRLFSQAGKFLTILSESVGLRVLNKHLTPKRLRNSHENIGNVRM